jgi:hypothetical protein
MVFFAYTLLNIISFWNLLPMVSYLRPTVFLYRFQRRELWTLSDI